MAPVQDASSNSEELTFASLEDELGYWKSEAERRGEELNEFQESSRELEKEMEAELERAENALKELRVQYDRLKADHENGQAKLQSLSHDSSKQISILQAEVTMLRKKRIELDGVIRQLEQDNDDLERRLRESAAAVEDFSHRLERAIEETVLTNSELEDTRTRDAETIQRLTDQVRDLQLEISVAAMRQERAVVEADPDPVPDNDVVVEEDVIIATARRLSPSPDQMATLVEQPASPPALSKVAADGDGSSSGSPSPAQRSRPGSGSGREADDAIESPSPVSARRGRISSATVTPIKMAALQPTTPDPPPLPAAATSAPVVVAGVHHHTAELGQSSAITDDEDGGDDGYDSDSGLTSPGIVEVPPAAPMGSSPQLRRPRRAPAVATAAHGAPHRTGPPPAHSHASTRRKHVPVSPHLAPKSAARPRPQAASTEDLAAVQPTIAEISSILSNTLSIKLRVQRCSTRLKRIMDPEPSEGLFPIGAW